MTSTISKKKKFIVFLVAGMSSRFQSTIPKQFAIVGPENEPLIEFSVKQACTQPFDEIIFVTNPLTRHLFVNHFGNQYMNHNVHYVDQYYDKTKRERPWGTTDAICSLRSFYSSSSNIFVIVNGDDLYGFSAFSKIIKYLSDDSTKNYIGGLAVKRTIVSDAPVNRGIISVEKQSKTNSLGLKSFLVEKIYEKTNVTRKDLDFLDEIANVNFLCLQEETIKALDRLLQQFQVDHENDTKIECFITSSLFELIQSQQLELYYFPLDENVEGITFQQDVPILHKKLKKKMN
jgi:UTP-glucose-1-phosphate uridylyltransferase